jgi:hypothetical protein
VPDVTPDIAQTNINPMITHPQAGDGIVDLEGYHWVVDGIATYSDTGAFRGVMYTNEVGERITLERGEYRRETFAEYLTRPTGFGRWTWGQFAFVQLMALGAVSAGVATIDEHGWVAFIVVAAVEVGTLFYMHRQYTGKTR